MVMVASRSSGVRSGDRRAVHVDADHGMVLDLEEVGRPQVSSRFPMPVDTDAAPMCTCPAMELAA